MGDNAFKDLRILPDLPRLTPALRAAWNNDGTPASGDLKGAATFVGPHRDRFVENKGDSNRRLQFRRWSLLDQPHKLLRHHLLFNDDFVGPQLMSDHSVGDEMKPCHDVQR